MYSVSKEMPLESYQVIQSADNQTDFIPGQVIRFQIPRSTGYWDSHLSKVQFNVKTTGANYKMCFNSPFAGMASMIDMVRISQNGKVISEILDYNQLQHFIKGYELSLSGLQRDAVSKGLVDYNINSNTGPKALSNHCLTGQSVHRTGEVSSSAMQQDVKFQMSLDFVSLFEVLEIVPSVALGDLLVEIRIAPTKEQILKVLPATGVAHGCTAIVAGTTINLTPPFTGFNNLADSPFIVGQKITSITAEGTLGVNEYSITALAQAVSTGVITITCGTIQLNDIGSNKIIISKGSDGNEAVSLTQFLVSKSELQLQIVKPPTQYTMEIVKEVESGQMFIDVDTYTSYRGTVLAGIKRQNLTLPTTQSRVKSFFSVLRAGTQPETLTKFNDTDFSFDGIYGNLRHYQSQIDGIYYPNVPIELGVMVGGWHFSQEHIRELEKAFDSSGLPLRSLLGLKQNFVLGRALSAYGSSTNLTGTPINVYLDYNGSGPITSTISNASASVTDGGSNYVATIAPAVLRTTGGKGSGMKVRVSGTGAFTGVTIVEQGSGYEHDDILTVIGGQAVFDSITEAGSGYTASTGVLVKGGLGSGMVITTTVDGGGAVDGVTITTKGTGYGTGDELTITGTNTGVATFDITVQANDGTITLSKVAPQLDAISFVHHTNRISVSPLGLEVMN